MKEAIAPFEATHDVSRWNGEHQDGPNSKFERVPHENGEMTQPKKGVKIDMSSLLNERVPFGKYKNKRWSEVPIGYLKWCSDNFDRRPKRLIDRVLKARQQ